MNALEVDCTQFVLEVLAPLNLARIVTELPNKLEAALPVLQVVRVGGPNDAVILDIPTFSLHAYTAAAAGGQKAANMLLQRAFTGLHAAASDVIPVDDGFAVLTRARMLGGPTWAPYDNPAVRHAVSTIQAHIKVA